jgi:hypothetical protein
MGVLNEGLKLLNIVFDKIEKDKIKSDITICLCTICFNEEKLLPFFLDYYSNFVKVDKMVFLDGNSTDKSHEIIKSYDIAELIIDNQEDGADEKKFRDIRNNVWKKYREDYDFVIVCDIDEFLYHPNIREKLKEYKDRDVTIPLIKGYDMISQSFPIFEKGKYITDLIKTGLIEDHWLAKKVIFNPKKIEEINYRYGSHDCDPIGDIIHNDEEELFLLHYKWLSYDYMTKRYQFLSSRRSKWNIDNGACTHWVENSLITKEEFDYKYQTSINVIKFNHFYESIDGWFDFETVYSNMVKHFKDGSHFVEIGAWLGKSTSYMAVEIINSGKNIKFDVIDTWEGSNEEIHKEKIEELNDNLYDCFLKNMKPIINKINPIKSKSIEASKLYEDNSLDFVFIDASHEYEDVIEDIKCWYPKIKTNGILGGHDYYVCPGVKKSVDEFFGNFKINIDDTYHESCGSWWIEKKLFEKNKKHNYIVKKQYFDNDEEELKKTKLRILEDYMRIENSLFPNTEIILEDENESSLLISYLTEKKYDKI